MSDDLSSPLSEVQDPELARLGAAPGKDLSPAARRALEEAAARREAEAAASLPAEQGGRDGPEPTRFGDWERKGVAVDF
ncbi:DUF1674 domain-containing protein [Caulobacter sp. D5]|uniref:DUF1674 domain-containing protein n=1 Tax=Caulobacter sp. D5 TaxID=357400 RepID=UPI000D72C705|nr:DUF1674 domain-containing protein [Caulobacter sp. D5]PXA87741.1 DUF1674 domain-containing protein [Caulobacter sp. D5]